MGTFSFLHDDLLYFILLLSGNDGDPDESL